MGKRKVYYKKRSKRSIAKENLSHDVKNTIDDASSNTDDGSAMSIDDPSGTDATAEDFMESFSIIHMNSLLTLLRQSVCGGCKMHWDGYVLMKKREGLYMYLEFNCFNCGLSTYMHSSPQIRGSNRREVNVRAAIGGTLCGLGYRGLTKLFGSLNLPAIVKETTFSKTQEFVLNNAVEMQQKSMSAAVEEAVIENGDSRELTVSGDGAWLTRGHSSVHGIAAICSTTTRPKVLDNTWCSKKCLKCQGAEGLRQTNPGLFSTYQENHQCQLNYTGSSGSMEKEMIHRMFSRSSSIYDCKYVSYVGDGDAKVHKHLTSNPPYPNQMIRKIEDQNHFAKRMLARIMKIKKENKKTILSDGKKLNGKGRLTDAHAIKFKIYFGKAIRENKTDLNTLYKRSWAIFKHHYSTDEEPMHDYCDVKWCKYLQSVANNQPFTHHSTARIPRPCLDMIKPVFDELCSRESLSRVIGGGSQNANECFHSLLWTMVPKHRYCSSTTLRLGLGLSTVVYNDGYESLSNLFSKFFPSVGYHSRQCFLKLDALRKSSALKKKKKTLQRSTTAPVFDTQSGGDDAEIQYTTAEVEADAIHSALVLFDQLEVAPSESDDDCEYEPGCDD